MSRTAIITGGSRGLGRAAAHALADHGWTVVIDGRNTDAVLATAAQLGPRVVPVPGDIANRVHRERLVAAADRRGGLDLLVNNAGTLGPTPLPPMAEYPLDALEEVFRVNVVSQLALIQVALPLLKRSSAPAIVNITSDAATGAYEGWGGYGASKAALEQVSNVVAVETPDVRVWSFDPGDMRTQMHQDAFAGEDIFDRPLPEDVAVPSLLRLLHERPPSALVRASALAGVA